MSSIRKAGSEEFKEELAEASKDPNYEARLRLSNDPETAKARAAKVGGKYDVSGYTDKEISMALQGDQFLDEDYARLTGKPIGGDDDDDDDGTDDVIEDLEDEDPVIIETDNPIEEVVDTDEPTVIVSPAVDTDQFLNTFIKNSFNAKGGTLINKGDITSQGDVTLDNSVTNSNSFNQIASNGYRLNLGDLKL